MTIADINKLIQELPSEERGKYEFDGHTSEDVLNRLKQL
jgi:hypothetical protein